MNIIISDIDKYIVDLVDLRTLANLLLVNKFFYEYISVKPVMYQWKRINSMKLYTINDIFTKICGMGFLEYAKYFVNENEIDIHAYNDYAFRLSCENGHLELAQWLIQLGESSGYTKIDIHASNKDAFRSSCYHGHIEVAQWLVQLGESDGYTKIDIHVLNEFAFKWSCLYGHLNIARWLIELGESSSYTKIDIHTDNDYAFRWSCHNGHIEIARWLISLDKYGNIRPELVKMLDIH